MTLLDEYHRKRTELIVDDRALRIDVVNGDRFSEKSRQADAILRRIREDEAKSIWAVEHEEVPHPFPGMEFLTGILKLAIHRVLAVILLRRKGHHPQDTALQYHHQGLSISKYLRISVTASCMIFYDVSNYKDAKRRAAARTS
jgi:hypothetical protein